MNLHRHSPKIHLPKAIHSIRFFYSMCYLMYIFMIRHRSYYHGNHKEWDTIQLRPLGSLNKRLLGVSEQEYMMTPVLIGHGETAPEEVFRKSRC